MFAYPMISSVKFPHSSPIAAWFLMSLTCLVLEFVKLFLLKDSIEFNSDKNCDVLQENEDVELFLNSIERQQFPMKTGKIWIKLLKF